jgi:NAD(P)-dependent dehydrogenase (short-subunit alcohol dehydrogenase family)
MHPILVSGGSSGLGAAVVAALAARERPAVVLDRVAPPAGGPHVLVDVADGRGVEAAIAALAASTGGFAGVITAAGTDSCGTLADVPAATWERTVVVNLLGTAAVVRGALPHLAPGARIVTVASTLGLRALPDATAYCASKFGVVGFTRALAAELAGRFGVTLIVPGGMATAFFDGRDEKYRPPPSLRLNPPENVAAAIVFALEQPPGCEIRELVVTPSAEPSWP